MNEAITVIGGGAIGGITAAYLARAGYEVIVVEPWFEHREAMKENLVVEGCRGIFSTPLDVISPEEIQGPLHIVLLAVKSMHTEDVMRKLSPMLQENSIVVSMQNSINEDLIAEIIGRERTIGCVVGWGAITDRAGHLSQASLGEFVIGRLDGHADERLLKLQKTMSLVTDTYITDNIYGFLWAKLLANCAISVGALQGKPVADLVSMPEARVVIRGIVSEVLDVAFALDICLETIHLRFEPEQYIVQKDLIADSLLGVLETAHGGIVPTAYQDLLLGKPLETNFINGYVVRKAKTLGIKTPLNYFLVNIINEMAKGSREIKKENIIELYKVCR